MLKASRKISIYSHLWQRKLKRKLKALSQRNERNVVKMQRDGDYDSHIIDDLPLTINRDPSPHSNFEQASL